MPERIQQRRTKGCRKPENTVSVARPSKWGNPFIVRRVSSIEWAVGVKAFGAEVFAGAEATREAAAAVVVRLFRDRLIEQEIDLSELRGKNLMCFCPVEDADGNRTPCHADVLLELANGGT
jgi:hypothetical protein